MDYVAHSEVAYAWGIEDSLMDRLLEDLASAPFDAWLRSVLAFARKLTLTPTDSVNMDAVFAAA